MGQVVGGALGRSAFIDLARVDPAIVGRNKTVLRWEQSGQQ